MRAVIWLALCFMWMGLFVGTTDWPPVGVVLLGIVCGTVLSIGDFILIAIISILED